MHLLMRDCIGYLVTESADVKRIALTPDCVVIMGSGVSKFDDSVDLVRQTRKS